MNKLLFATAAFVFSLYAFADESGLLDKNAGIITRPSKYPVPDTMDRVEAAAKSSRALAYVRL